jgi:hypothetical protein
MVIQRGSPGSGPYLIMIIEQSPVPTGTTTLYVGALTLDVLLGDVHSLKQKRGVVRPLVAELRRRFPGVAVAETGHLDLHRRAEIGVAVVSATHRNATEVLEECERLVAGRPEVELLSARQRLFTEEE